jgi:hypothetical protein
LGHKPIRASAINGHQQSLRANMTRREKLFASISVCAATVFLLLTVEGASYYVNKAQGKKTAFLIARSTFDKQRHYGTFDPHFGYARWLTDDDKTRLNENNFEWVDGFVVYKKNKDLWTRPIILTLGGSTTDGIRRGHSWPEELSKLMTADGNSGTVVNGGTGGYSSNQELLKLIRDGLEFKPDIVISYSGINDMGKYNELHTRWFTPTKGCF